MIVRNGGTQKLTVDVINSGPFGPADGNTVVERYAYDVFGKRIVLDGNGLIRPSGSAYNNGYGYTSRRHDDETGLMYFVARYYDNQTASLSAAIHSSTLMGCRRTGGILCKTETIQRVSVKVHAHGERR